MAKGSELIIAIDAGTQSIRAIAFTRQGNIVDMVKTEIEPYFSDYPGWAEQDPEYYWKTLCTTTKKLFKKGKVKKDAVQGVTLTTQRDTVINVDKNGKPLRPAIVWLDQRQADKSIVKLPLHIKAGLKFVNMLDAVEYVITEAEANWIKQYQPEVWDRTYKFLFLSGFFTYRLVGEFIDSVGCQVGYIPFDYKRQGWASSGDLKWRLFPFTKDQLVAVVKPADVLGYITKKASQETGLPQGLPLIAAAADKACEVLGSGCLTPNIACLSYGTTATVETTNEKYVEIIPFFPPYPSAVPGAYNTEVMVYRGFWMLSWFVKEFGAREEQQAKKLGIKPEALFDKLVSEVPPGSMGLTLQPYWSPGVKVPGPEAKGAIIGFGDVHTRVHVYRAILEGLAYALREGAERTQKRNKVPIEKLRVSGGGAQSDVAMQLTADIFNLPAERPHTFETSALGAAIDAAVGLKMYPDFKTAVSEMTRVGKVFYPNPKEVAIYDKLYKQVYKKLYNRLQPLYKDIRDITGYPQKR